MYTEGDKRRRKERRKFHIKTNIKIDYNSRHS